MNLALFDFDGTITCREMFPAFIRHAVTPRRLRLGGILLAPLVVGYRLGLVSGSVVRAAIVKVGFSGAGLSRYQAAGESFARDVLPGSLRPEAMQRIAWHQQQGDTVVVVSGALDVYLGHWCASHGLDLLCSSLGHRRGVLTGRYAGKQCVLAEKARRVRQHYDPSNYEQVFAYGDTPEDRDLLALADRKTYRWRELGE
ncbi:MAG: HAD family hydrolase [Lysobacter sp.]